MVVVNDLTKGSNSNIAHERHPISDEQLRPGANILVPAFDYGIVHSYRAMSRKLTTAIILIFWIFQYVGLSLLFRIMSPEASQDVYLPRGIVSSLGVLISFGMVAIQNRLRGASLSRRAAIAAIMALICPVFITASSVTVFALIMPYASGTGPTLSNLMQDYLYRLWIFVALSAIILALSYAADVREREEAIGRLQTLAQSAQLRALRNQLNPHSCSTH
jgi:hypothetical protein